MSAPAPMAPTAAAPTWEFSPEQNVILARLSGRMRFVGVALITLAGLLVLWSLLGTGSGDMMALQVAMVLGLTGLWSWRAAAAFARVVTTRGSDPSHVMRALAELAKLYELQYWVFLLVAVLLAATVLIAVTGAPSLQSAW